MELRWKLQCLPIARGWLAYWNDLWDAISTSYHMHDRFVGLKLCDVLLANRILDGYFGPFPPNENRSPD